MVWNVPLTGWILFSIGVRIPLPPPYSCSLISLLGKRPFVCVGVCTHRLPCCAVSVLLIMAEHVASPLVVAQCSPTSACCAVPCCVSVANNGWTGCLLLVALCVCLLLIMAAQVNCPLLVVLCVCLLLIMAAQVNCPLLVVLCVCLLLIMAAQVNCPLLVVLCVCQLLMMAEKGCPRGL